MIEAPAECQSEAVMSRPFKANAMRMDNSVILILGA